MAFVNLRYQILLCKEQEQSRSGSLADKSSAQSVLGQAASEREPKGYMNSDGGTIIKPCALGSTRDGNFSKPVIVVPRRAASYDCENDPAISRASSKQSATLQSKTMCRCSANLCLYAGSLLEHTRARGDVKMCTCDI